MEQITRYFRAPRGSFFLFGPRGTGKSTWLGQAFPDALVVDLLDPETHRTMLARPERLRELVDGEPGARTVVVDEVQKVPALLDVVHQIVEARDRKALRFVLTGSSARKLKRTGVNLLGGRLALRTMHPLLASELGDRFDMRKALEMGMIPLVVFSGDPAEALSAYAELYLKEEVQAEGLVRNLGDFARFLEAASFSHGSLLNVSSVARECGIGQKTAEGYFGILQDLLIAFLLPPFARRAKRRTAKHPKFYFFDAGVFGSLRPRGPLDTPDEIGGAALEGLVAQHLRAWIAYGPAKVEMCYWRTKSGVEVDFVLYGEGGITAIEVKASRQVFPGDVKPLKAFLKDYPRATVCLLYGGDRRLRIQGIHCLPCAEFLRGLVPGRPLPGPATSKSV